MLFDQVFDLDKAVEILPREQAHVSPGARRRDEPLTLVFPEGVGVHAHDAGGDADDIESARIGRVHRAIVSHSRRRDLLHRTDRPIFRRNGRHHLASLLSP